MSALAYALGDRLDALFPPPVWVILLGVLVVGGCNAVQAYRPTAAVVAEGVLLHAEMDRAYDAMAALPLSPGERSLMDAAMRDFLVITEQLDADGLTLRSLALAIASPSAMSRNLLDEIVAAYMMAHLSYTSYLDRTGAGPSALLVRYDESARSLYAEIDATLRANNGRADLAEIRGYLALVLRAVSAFAF